MSAHSPIPPPPSPLPPLSPSTDIVVTRHVKAHANGPNIVDQ